MKTIATNPGARLFLVRPGSGGPSRSLSTTGDNGPTIAGKTLPMRPGFFAADRRLNQHATSAKHVSVRSQPARTADTAPMPSKSLPPKTPGHKPNPEVAATHNAAAEKPLAGGKKSSQPPPAAPTPTTPHTVRKKAPVVRRKLAGGKGRRHPVNPSSRAQSTREPKAVAGQTSKKDTVLALLRRPQGATVKEIMRATGWQSHSVRGFLSGALRKKMGLKVKSAKRNNGERVYSVRG
jgi:uncharacterized protein DUF3489